MKQGKVFLTLLPSTPVNPKHLTKVIGQRLKILSEYQIAHQQTKPSSVLILIGPEGDFTPSEINLALNSGCIPMTLGPIVLRSETAALYSLSVLSYELL